MRQALQLQGLGLPKIHLVGTVFTGPLDDV
jgi:hypothetical protein